MRQNAPEPVVCRRCGSAVPAAEERHAVEVFEHMHYACFHYEFEHGHERSDLPEDVWCDVPGCPAQPECREERLALRQWGQRRDSVWLDDRQEAQLERLAATGWTTRPELVTQLLSGNSAQVEVFLAALRDAAGERSDGSTETADERAERLARSDAYFDQLRSEGSRSR